MCYLKLPLFQSVILIIACFLLSSCEKETPPFSMAEGTWKTFNTVDGLPENFITAIGEDHHGNIWIGTNSNGVAVYDGSEWKSYKAPKSLIDNRIRSICTRKDGTVLIGTLGGISFQTDEGWFYISSISGISLNVKCLFEDSKQRLWIGTYGNGFIKYDEKGGSVHFYNSSCEECNYTNTVEEDHKGTIWIGTEGPIYKYSGTTLSKTDSDLPIDALLEDKWNSMWIASFYHDKLLRFNGSTYDPISLNNGMESTGVLSMTQDYLGNIWFTTMNLGVVKYNGVSMQSFTQREGLPAYEVVCSFADSRGNLWFGTMKGGLTRYTPEL